LARELAIPLAGGEILESAEAASACLSGGSFDLIQPDVSICGGMGGVLELARLATAAGRMTVPHCCSGAIAMAATLQVLAVLEVPDGAPAWAEPLLEFDVGENPIRTDLSTTPFAPIDGWMTIPDGPGLGIDIDEAEVRRLTVAA
jgi:D-galactarolactone cycloisomerase